MSAVFVSLVPGARDTEMYCMHDMILSGASVQRVKNLVVDLMPSRVTAVRTGSSRNEVVARVAKARIVLRCSVVTLRDRLYCIYILALLAEHRPTTLWCFAASRRHTAVSSRSRLEARKRAALSNKKDCENPENDPFGVDLKCKYSLTRLD
jgi:hypothetical protein